ncbi:MAG: recG [Candidatus Doudnabacteria bacterium]|nr:recG [Candidatus Doudnabacteria bacterium]
MGVFDKKLEKDLTKLGIATISDLLFYFPFRYEDFSNVAKIVDLKAGDQISIKAEIKEIRAIPGFYGKKISRAEAVVSDDSGSMKVVWFNQPYLANNFKKGDQIFLAGTVRFYKTLQLQNPVYEKIRDEDQISVHTARILPIYRLTGSLSLRALRTAIYNALQAQSTVEETLPSEIVKDLGLLDITTTVKNLHFPETDTLLQQAKDRMAFEEIFFAQLAIQKHKNELGQQKATPFAFNKTLVQKFTSSLPFELTADQKKAIWDILQDLEKPQPMNRLLEGDVGSGKTLVAFTAALEVVNAEKQAVLLCPTEILAQQHYKSALKYFEEYSKISLILLTSKRAILNGKEIAKKELLQEIKHGGPQLIISTHAVLEKNVEFEKLGLVIIDEQHRFGVRQRALLKQKTKDIHPHLLSMSATPIPRTLRLTLFGDLQISQINQMPADRKVIKTKLVPNLERPAAYEFIRKQIGEGRQAFVVTPLIEESDRLGVKAATSEYESLQKEFPGLVIGLLHGKMKADQKEQVMADFLANKINILVSTSVIEVGVDVPNASVMFIEGADRFGLAQLHQFRGRVGRSEFQSFCFIFTENENEKTLERLEKFTQTTNGFELAEIDLKNRGFGNIFGEEQSGFYYFKYFNYDAELSDKAKYWAKKILASDPKLIKHPDLFKKIEDKVIHLE